MRLKWINDSLCGKFSKGKYFTHSSIKNLEMEIESMTAVGLSKLMVF